jgi:hypothetical protein
MSSGVVSIGRDPSATLRGLRVTVPSERVFDVTIRQTSPDTMAWSERVITLINAVRKASAAGEINVSTTVFKDASRNFQCRVLSLLAHEARALHDQVSDVDAVHVVTHDTRAITLERRDVEEGHGPIVQYEGYVFRALLLPPGP